MTVHQSAQYDRLLIDYDIVTPANSLSLKPSFSARFGPFGCPRSQLPILGYCLVFPSSRPVCLMFHFPSSPNLANLVAPCPSILRCPLPLSSDNPYRLLDKGGTDTLRPYDFKIVPTRTSWLLLFPFIQQTHHSLFKSLRHHM